MTSQLSRLSVLALFPLLTLNCDATESDLADAQESDTGSFDQFRNHFQASLEGSNFEIDFDANLKVDGNDPPNLDWANVNDTKINEPISKNDSSYAGGVKEDSICPPVGTGSIPVNKSDITSFGLYEERIQGGFAAPGFLHLYWARVQEPSGTTLMDFELNQSSEECPGANPHNVRTINDLLIEYRIEQGGASAAIRIRKWTANGWGPAVLLTPDQATGTINSSFIEAADANGLGHSLDPRTFGEASIDLDVIFDGQECRSFGSAFAKSRASDSFTSALKDYTAPIPVSITNCGGVTIRKDVIPDDPDVPFFFTHDMEVNGEFTLNDGDAETFDEVLLNHAYTVTEDQSNTDYDLIGIDCSASIGVTPVVDVDAGTATFTLDSDSDRVDCTYTNRRKGGVIKVQKTRGHAADGPGRHPHQGVTFEVEGLDDQVTNADGEICFGPLDVGFYDVSEMLPDGYAPEGELTQSVQVIENTTCLNATPVVFHNIPLTNLECEVDSQVVGGTSSTITCTGMDPVQTDANGDGKVTLTDLRPGEYSCTVVIDDGVVY
jgi:hypothetical protein